MHIYFFHISAYFMCIFVTEYVFNGRIQTVLGQTQIDLNNTGSDSHELRRDRD